MRLFNDILYFPTVEVTEDELGQKVKNTIFYRQVFCEKKSIPQSEFFAAGQTGIKASRILVVHKFDYAEEVNVKYQDKIYHVYRIYERPDEKIELYCEVRAGG